jgi:inward rectifier potassium channel
MISKIYKSLKDYNDSGLSNLVANQGSRFLNKDGSFNVKKTGVPLMQRLSFFNALITMSWPKFLLIVVCTYFILNLFFASIYFFIGIEHLAGTSGVTPGEQFLEEFFFSAQTLTTVGYGRVNPVGLAANILAALEAMTGLLCFALATGLLYGRFSRPVANIIFSEKALMAPFHDGKALMFRLANAKNNPLVDADIQVLLSMVVWDNGRSVRRFFDLPLQLKTINFLTMNWTVVHPIDDKSPFFGLTGEDLAKADAEIMISLKAFDDTFAQTISARHSYKFDEIEWNAKFKTMFERSKDGKTTVLHLDKIGDFEKA